MRDIRVVVLGGQRHLPLYLRALRASGRFEVAGIWVEPTWEPWVQSGALDAASAARVAVLHDLDHALTSADVAVVCAGPEMQPHLARAAAAAGLHLWLDQPLAADSDGITILDRAVASTTNSVHVSHRRFSDASTTAARAIKGGDLGLPFSANLELLVAAPASTQLEGGLAPAFLGGELTRLGPVAVDTLAAVLGVPVAAHAFTGTAFSQQHRDEQVEDVALLTVDFADGTVGTAIVGRAPLGSGFSPVHESLQVRGTRGSLTATSTASEEQVVGAFVDDLIHVLNGQQQKYTYDEARAAWAVIHAIRACALDASTMEGGIPVA